MIQVHYEAFKEVSHGFTKYVRFKNKLKNYTFLNTYGWIALKSNNIQGLMQIKSHTCIFMHKSKV